jgi:hypothetical protein
VTNEADGGHGLFVYDVAARTVLWSKVVDRAAQHRESRRARAVSFALDDTVVLVSQPKAVTAYRTANGKKLGRIETTADLRDGFIVEQARKRVWLYERSIARIPLPPTVASRPKSGGT